MTYRIKVDFDLAEGALVRILGLVERRGFFVRSIGMTEHDDGRTAVLVVEVSPRDPGRRLEVVDLQLRRLIDVRSVTHCAAAMASAA